MARTWRYSPAASISVGCLDLAVVDVLPTVKAVGWLDVSVGPKLYIDVFGGSKLFFSLYCVLGEEGLDLYRQYGDKNMPKGEIDTPQPIKLLSCCCLSDTPPAPDQPFMACISMAPTPTKEGMRTTK